MKIIDVSANNGRIDWSQLVKEGVAEVFIRLTLGVGTLDPKAYFYATEAIANGIAVSYYHVAYPDTKSGGNVVADATKEAAYFCEMLHEHGMPAPKDIVVDLETETALSREDFTLWLTTFLQHVKVLSDKDPIIYSYKSYLDEHLLPGHQFGNYRLWIANYNNVSEPVLPNGWETYYQWQYSETGTIAGITGHVDLNKRNSNV